jgi:hypothetical protein
MPLNPEAPHYITGGEVQVGDRVSYKGVAGTIVFITDGEQGKYAPGYEDYLGHEAGLMISDDDGGLTFLPEPGDDLEFLRRKDAPVV